MFLGYNWQVHNKSAEQKTWLPCSPEERIVDLLDSLDSIAYFGTFDFVHFILYLIMALLLLSYDFILLFSNIF